MPKFWPWSWMVSIWQPWTMKSGHFYGYKKPLLWWFERAQGKSKSQKPFPFFKLSIVECFRRTRDVLEGQGKVKNCPTWLLWPFISDCCFLHCGSNSFKKGISYLISISIPNYVRQLHWGLLMSFDFFSWSCCLPLQLNRYETAQHFSKTKTNTYLHKFSFKENYWAVLGCFGSFYGVQN